MLIGTQVEIVMGDPYGTVIEGVTLAPREQWDDVFLVYEQGSSFPLRVSGWLANEIHVLAEHVRVDL